MSRIIREHRVFGKAVVVKASSEEEARKLATPKGDWSAWEITLIADGTNDATGLGTYEVYVAEHDAVFALND